MPKAQKPTKPAKQQLPHPQATPYTATAISLHWLIGVLMIGNLLFGWALAHDYWEAPFSHTLVGWHKSVGVLVLILAATRLTYRMTHNYPGYVPMPNWMRIAAELNHYALYVLIFWMPLTGYLMSSAGGHPTGFFGLFTLPNFMSFNPDLGKQLFALHMYGMWAGFFLISLHIAAALYHQLWRKDGTLGRMLPFLRDIGQPARR
jgi:cytochrome b561